MYMVWAVSLSAKKLSQKVFILSRKGGQAYNFCIGDLTSQLDKGYSSYIYIYIGYIYSHIYRERERERERERKRERERERERAYV